MDKTYNRDDYPYDWMKTVFFCLYVERYSCPQTLSKWENVVVQMDGDKRSYLGILDLSENRLDIPIIRLAY